MMSITKIAVCARDYPLPNNIQQCESLKDKTPGVSKGIL